MREIKFRAWDKEQAKMKKDFRFDEFNDVNDYFADNDFVFMQFTGLKDKNGKEIYEGDILLLPDKELGKVFWGRRYVGFWVDLGGDFAETLEAGLAKDSEIIGNIYENKELKK